MKIGFIGDTHGHWEGLSLAVKKLSDAGATMFIQVGDFGYWPQQSVDKWMEYDPHTNIKDHTIHWIDGNHEHHDNLREVFDTNILEPQPMPNASNIFYVPRGTTLEIDGIKFGFLGGAWSIDHSRREEGISVFKTEQIEEEHLLILSEEVDFMVTHDAPYDAYKSMNLPDPLHFFGVAEKDCDHSGQKKLQEILEKKRPKWWVHGHYHRKYQRDIKGCNINGLDMTRTTPKGKTDVEGAVLVFDIETRTFQ